VLRSGDKGEGKSSEGRVRDNKHSESVGAFSPEKEGSFQYREEELGAKHQPSEKPEGGKQHKRRGANVRSLVEIIEVLGRPGEIKGGGGGYGHISWRYVEGITVTGDHRQEHQKKRSIQCSL